jgi:hypothetical protein
VPRSYKEDNGRNQVSCLLEFVKIESVGRELPFREHLSMKAEEPPLLEVVTRERLLKTQKAGTDLACAVVICKAWRLAMAL